MEKEIGAAAGAIWHVLNSKGGLTFSRLQKEVDVKAPIFDWAIGWLAREDKIAIGKSKRSFVIELKGSHAKAAGF
jgi:hypothetical protein